MIFFTRKMHGVSHNLPPVLRWLKDSKMTVLRCVPDQLISFLTQRLGYLTLMDSRVQVKPHTHRTMTHPTSSFYLIDDGQSGSSTFERRNAHRRRDCNANNGSGSFTVYNDTRILQQTRPTQQFIRGNDEEEMEYEQVSMAFNLAGARFD